MYLYPDYQKSPERYKGIKDEPPFNFKESFYLHGSTGTGKTYYSWSLINILNRADWEANKEWHKVPDMQGNRFKQTYHFVVNVPEIMLEYRSASFEDKASLSKSFSKYNIVFDDIGAEYQSEFTQEFLFAILDERWNSKLWTSFTSNLSIGKLPYGDRVKSRIAGIVGKNIHKLDGKDRRLA